MIELIKFILYKKIEYIVLINFLLGLNNNKVRNTKINLKRTLLLILNDLRIESTHNTMCNV